MLNKTRLQSANNKGKCTVTHIFTIENLKPISTLGFTLIELLIVVAILAILATLFINTFPNSQRRGRDTVRKSDIKQYQTTLEIFANKNNGLYPVTSKDMDDVCDDSFPTGLGMSSSSCPVDPQGTSYEYVSISSGAGYFVWGALETSSSTGADLWFVVCSNGVSDEATSDPTGASDCPL